jgi:hypothetical protein
MRIIVVLVLLALAGVAHAGACPSAQLASLPGDGAVAVPTNVRPRVVFRAATVEAHELADPTTRRVVASGTVVAADAEVLVRKTGGAIVPATIRRTTAAPHLVVTVEPTAALAAATRYEVVVRSKTAAYAVAHFTTAAAPDTVAPTLAKADHAQLVTWKPSRPPHWKDPHGSYVEVAVSATDEAAFEIHVLAPGEPASDATLRTIALQSAGKLRFGVVDSCAGADFAIPAATKTQPKLHVSIRAVDLAGNASPLRELTIDLAKPRYRD